MLRLAKNRKRKYHTLSYARAIVETSSESIETTVRRRRMLFAGFGARMRDEKHLPRRVMFGEMIGGKGYIYGGTYICFTSIRGRPELKSFFDTTPKQ